MKNETLLKFKELLNNEKLQFVEVPEGLAVNHDLTDSELAELVELEYGQTKQSVVDLFTVMCKKLVKLAGDENVPV